MNQGDYLSALSFLKNDTYEKLPIAYRTYGGVSACDILKNLNVVERDDYSIISKLPPITSVSPAEFMLAHKKRIISIKESEHVDISESKTLIDIKDKFQVSIGFTWLYPIKWYIESFGLVFYNDSNEELFISISERSFLKLYKSENLEFEIEINPTIIYEKKQNRLTVQRYNNFLEIFVNDNSLLKLEATDSYQSVILRFLGVQTIKIETLSLSNLERKWFGEGLIINEKAFSAGKNYSIIQLIEVLQSKKIDSSFFNYFVTIGAVLKQDYFDRYTKDIISENYICNLTVLHDLFVNEFYYSLYHLVDYKEEYSLLTFYNSFSRLSDNAEKKIKELFLGFKPYVFENFIKEISSKRLKEPEKAYEFACDLKNEATHFYIWYSEFYGVNSVVSKSLSDKVGNEILECSIAYYNAINPKTTELAKQALRLMTWVSDFAFDQTLRDRINKNILTLLNVYQITEYTIIDFDQKDRTRTNRRIINTGKQSVNNHTNTNNDTTKTDKVTQPLAVSDKKISKKSINRKNEVIENKLKKTFSILFLMLLIAFVLYSLFSPEKKDNSLININQNQKPKNSTNKSENFSKLGNESLWKGNQLNNGSSPYDGIFGKGIYDYDSECWITFKNGNSTDAIVCLENISNGRTIRNEYIQAGTDYQMTNIPEGVYKVKVFYGNDWNPEKKLNNGEISGGFDTDQSFSLSDKPDDLIRMKITETYNGISYTTGEITLYTVSNGNMNQRDIKSDEFFK